MFHCFQGHLEEFFPCSKYHVDTDSREAHHAHIALPFWQLSNNPENKLKTNLELDHVQYINLKYGQEGKSDTEVPYSVPVRLRNSGSGFRCTVSVPLGGREGITELIPCVLVTQVYKGTVFLSLRKDSSPAFQIHNNCGFDIMFGQEAPMGMNGE